MAAAQPAAYSGMFLLGAKVDGKGWERARTWRFLSMANSALAAPLPLCGISSLCWGCAGAWGGEFFNQLMY